MKTDADLKTDVMAELAWDASINASHVGVAVADGVVTLTGHLDTFAEKYAVERAVQRVRGVRAIAVELDVKLEHAHQRNDAEIGAAAQQALEWQALVPADQIQIRVEKGWVTLKGEVDWHHQRQAAERVVRSLTGVVGVSNAVNLKACTTPANVARRIRDALERHAQHEARHLEVMVNGSVVTLRGQVGSLSERSAVCSAAWSAPGVASVIDEIVVRT